MPAHQPQALKRHAARLWLGSLLWLAAASPGLSQQIMALNNGFTIGSSSGQTSFYRQVSNSEASVLLRQLSTNVSPAAGSAQDPRYTITNPLEPFSISNERHSRSAGSSTTSIGGGFFSGFNMSVFYQ